MKVHTAAQTKYKLQSNLATCNKTVFLFTIYLQFCLKVLVPVLYINKRMLKYIFPHLQKQSLRLKHSYRPVFVFANPNRVDVAWTD